MGWTAGYPFSGETFNRIFKASRSDKWARVPDGRYVIISDTPEAMYIAGQRADGKWHLVARYGGGPDEEPEKLGAYATLRDAQNGAEAHWLAEKRTEERAPWDDEPIDPWRTANPRRRNEANYSQTKYAEKQVALGALVPPFNVQSLGGGHTLKDAFGRPVTSSSGTPLSWTTRDAAEGFAWKLRAVASGATL